MVAKSAESHFRNSLAELEKIMNCGPDLAGHWATVVATAMHFNEMLLSTRSLIASVMLALIGAAALSVVRLEDKHAYFGRVHVGLLILLGGLLFLGCVFALDYFYYFKLLLGSVDVAETLERQCSSLPRLTIELSELVSQDLARLVILLFYGVIASAMIVLGGLIWCRRMKGR